MMSRLSNYIKSQSFNRDALAFFIGYLVVSFAVGAGIFILVGALGFFHFYFLVISQYKELKK